MECVEYNMLCLCVILSKKSSYEHGSEFERLPRYGKKKIRTNPASTNSNYVIINITTNITCMQVLTIVLLVICNGQNPGSSTSGTSHNKCSKMPPPTSMHKMPPPTSVHKCIEVGGGIFEHLL